jgi:hypothetical protein
MPKFDGTGPHGMGPGTGRGFGPCFGFGPGHACRHNRGLGRYFGWNQPQTKEEKLEAISNYKKALEEELEDIKKEQEEVEKE